MPGSEVGEVVAVYGCDYDVFKLQVFYRAHDVGYLLRIDRKRLSGGHVAESAAARAYVSAYHESGSSVAPAFATVWTHAGRAYCVQMLLVEKSDHLRGLESAGQFYLKPVRFCDGSRLSVSLGLWFP